jgi:hypothetical protein
MKLNPEDVVVSSFETTLARAVGLPTTDDPTPQTRCFDCPGEPADVDGVIKPGGAYAIR